MTPSDFLQMIEMCFRAAKKDGAAQFYRLAGVPFSLEFASEGLRERFAASLRHLQVEPEEAISFRIAVWESRLSGVHPPPPPWSPEAIREKGEIPSFSTERVKYIYSPDPGILHCIDWEKNIAYYWIRDRESIPYWESAVPFRIPLSLFLARRARLLIHAAAVGSEKGVCLLVGKGGSGKSTTAVGCLEKGNDFLGDDYCLLSCDGRPEVHSIYASAKLTSDSLARFPSLSSLRKEVGEEKEVIYLEGKYLAQIPSERALKAIFIPKIGKWEKTHFVPASFSAALNALAPSTIFQLPGTSGETFHTLARWLKNLPCYFLHLSSDVSEVAAAIDQFLRKI